jgi:hypothetical protein
MSSDNSRELIIATLAAAIVEARQSTAVNDIQQAWLDAG